MRVKLIFDAQFVGYEEEIVEVPDNTTDKEIKAMFPEHLLVEFDHNCSYEIIE